MTKQGFAMLQDVIMDDSFPDLDLALRRGRHIDRDDADWYALLSDAQEQLELFYRRYGCELIHKTDGYFYLLPTGDKLSRRQLAPGDMLVGQALALLYLDPATIERGGLVSQEELVAQLSTVLGSDALIGAFNPKRKRHDERIAQKNVRSRVAESVRRLAAFGFIQVADAERLRLRPALMRFAEPVRAASEPSEALAKLVARGEVALLPEEGTGEGDESPDDAFDAEDAAESAEATELGGEPPEVLVERPAAVSGRELEPAAPSIDAPPPSGERSPAVTAQAAAGEHAGEQLVLGGGEPRPTESTSEPGPPPAPAAPPPPPAAVDDRELDWDDLDLLVPADPDADSENEA